MCWLDYVREQGFGCLHSFECYLFMLSIVDYKKRTLDDGVDFLMSRCPVLDQVIVGMGKQGTIRVRNLAPEDVIRKYLGEIGKDFHERVKKVKIPEELQPMSKEIARRISNLAKAGVVSDDSFENLVESLLKRLKE